MATYAARRLTDIADNVAHILAIEFLAAAQGVDLRAPNKTSPTLQLTMETIRQKVTHYDADRYFAPDLLAAYTLVRSGNFAKYSPFAFASMQ